MTDPTPWGKYSSSSGFSAIEHKIMSMRAEGKTHREIALAINLSLSRSSEMLRRLKRLIAEKEALTG